jgi:serine phosphatase RsbU (regulator of sigma subunit)
VEKVTAAVKNFVGSALPSDDITMLALRRVDASAI